MYTPWWQRLSKPTLAERFELQKFNVGGRVGFADGPPGKIGAPITGETISKSEFNRIKKLLADRPCIGIYPTQ